MDATSGPGPGTDPDGLRPNLNVTPTASVPVVLERSARVPASRGSGGTTDEGRTDGDGTDRPGSGDPPATVRWLRMLGWGLVPPWAARRPGGRPLINARSETVLEKPAFRAAARARRCLVPADGWYEWQATAESGTGRGRGRKQPFVFRPLDGDVIAFAGLYDVRREPSLPPEDPASWVATFAVLTTVAEPDLEDVHDRMPLVLPRDRWDAWLDPGLGDDAEVGELLRPPPPGRFSVVPVDRVGDPLP